MNDRQHKLKSILDRYAACTLSLEDAEKDLESCLLGNYYTTAPCRGEVMSTTTFAGDPYVYINEEPKEVPIAYIESDRRLSPYAVEEIHKQWNEVHGGNVRLIVLDGGLHLVNQHGYEPRRITAKVGSFELETSVNNSKFWEATFDGEPIRPHRKLTFVMEVGKAPIVTVEYVPFAYKKDS